MLTVSDPVHDAHGNASAPSGDNFSSQLKANRMFVVSGHLKPWSHSGEKSSWVAEVFGEQGIAADTLQRGLATEAAVRVVTALSCYETATRSPR